MIRRITAEVLQKLKRMTILVGMVGSDGIVLAADGRMVRPASHAGEYDDISSIVKITNLSEHGVCYAAAGDYISWRAGQILSEALDAGDFDFTNIQRFLESVGAKAFVYEREAIEKTYVDDQDRNAVLAQTREPLPRGLLVVFYGGQIAQRQLWGLNLQPTTCFAKPANMAIYGAAGNLARFFGGYFIEHTPIGRLQLLGAHIVLTAHRFDSLMIDGLEVAVFDTAGYRRLASEELSGLRKRSEALDSVIRRELLREVEEKVSLGLDLGVRH